MFCFIIISCEKNNDTIKKEICPDCIVAGDSTNNLYTNIIPDTILSTSGIMGDIEYLLDIDGNNTNDFKIVASYSSGISHEISKVSIEPYGNNQIAFADSVPATYANDTVFYINLAKGVNYGDTINNVFEFKNEELYLETNSYVVLMYSVDASWERKDYIPVNIELEPGNINYGWIKVNDVSTRKIIIESYAINIP